MACNCKTEIPKRVWPEPSVYCMMEQYGFNLIRFKGYRKGGEKSKVNRYKGEKWEYCPFCGEHL